MYPFTILNDCMGLNAHLGCISLQHLAQISSVLLCVSSILPYKASVRLTD